MCISDLLKGRNVRQRCFDIFDRYCVIEALSQNQALIPDIVLPGESSWPILITVLRSSSGTDCFD